MSGRVIEPSLFTVDGIARGSGVWSFGLPDVGWLAQGLIAGSGNNYICMGTAVAPDGSIFACGSIDTTFNNPRPWLAKFDENGVFQWIRGRNYSTIIGGGFTDVAVGSDNNPVVTGWADGGGVTGAINGKYDSATAGLLHLRRISPTLGTYDQLLSGGVFTYINEVAIDPATNNYYIVASSRDFGPLAGFAPSAYLIRLSAFGTPVWARWININGSNTYGYSVAYCNATGNVYVGCTNGAGATIQPFSSSGVAGTPVSLSNANGEVFFSLKCDSAGNVYAGGNVRRFAASTGWWLAKFNSSLTLQWQRELFELGVNCDIARIGINAAGNRIAIAGIRPHTSGLTAGVAIFDDSGTLQWQRRMTDTAGASTARAAAFGSNNQPVIAADAAVNGQANIWRLPSDGSGTGTYGGSIYTGADPLTVTPAAVAPSTPTVTTGAFVASAVNFFGSFLTPTGAWSVTSIP